jgi:hypothetical protein
MRMRVEENLVGPRMQHHRDAELAGEALRLARERFDCGELSATHGPNA